MRGLRGVLSCLERFPHWDGDEASMSLQLWAGYLFSLSWSLTITHGPLCCKYKMGTRQTVFLSDGNKGVELISLSEAVVALRKSK